MTDLRCMRVGTFQCRSWNLAHPCFGRGVTPAVAQITQSGPVDTVSDPRRFRASRPSARSTRAVEWNHAATTRRPPCHVGTGPVSFDDVVAVARHGAAVALDRRVARRDRPGPRRRRGAGRGRDPGVRHLDRLRRAGHPAHPDRDARPAAEVAGALARGRLRPRGRARGRPGADAAAALDARDRAHRRTPRDGAADRRRC